MTSSPSVTAVICCFNSAWILSRTLDCLARQDIDSRYWTELLIVDNNSTDETVEVAREKWAASAEVPLRIVSEPQQGAGYARFRALREARGDVVVFVDDDVFPGPSFLRLSAESMDRYPEAGAVGGINEPVFEGDPPSWFQQFHRCYAVGPQGSPQADVDYLYGAGMAVRKRAWMQLLHATKMESFLCCGRKAGEVAGGGEDYEICIALRYAGWKIKYIPQMKAGHFLPPKRLTWDYFCKLIRSYGRARVRIDCYENAFPDTSNARRPLFADTWWGASVPGVKRLVELWLRPPRGFDRKEKDKRDVRQILYLKGKLQELMQMGRYYRRNIREVQKRFSGVMERSKRSSAKAAL